jgi:hypothetical protein
MSDGDTSRRARSKRGNVLNEAPNTARARKSYMKVSPEYYYCSMSAFANALLSSGKPSECPRSVEKEVLGRKKGVSILTCHPSQHNIPNPMQETPSRPSPPLPLYARHNQNLFNRNISLSIAIASYSNSLNIRPLVTPALLFLSILAGDPALRLVNPHTPQEVILHG